jgi:hypothetical protein
MVYAFGIVEHKFSVRGIIQNAEGVDKDLQMM